MSSTLSFEVFPPNTQVGTEKLHNNIGGARQLAPDFISVTCSNNRQNHRRDDVEGSRLYPYGASGTNDRAFARGLLGSSAGSATSNAIRSNRHSSDIGVARGYHSRAA